MNNLKFIEEMAAHVQKIAPLYGIRVYSPIIAQGVLESASGTSELAMNANNFFGLKWRENRCPSADGCYFKIGSEQNPDGSYASGVMKWFKFPDMEAGVRGYFDFINNSRYASVKGVTDPETYLKNIKAAGYATSLKYVENLMNVIKKYDLTKYDDTEGANMLKIAIDAGHGLNTAGKRCLKSLDPKESREWLLNSRIAEKLEDMLKTYDCEVLRVDDATGKKDISLAERCEKADKWGADVYISIHHNAGINGGSGGGTEVYYCSTKAERAEQAKKLYDCIVKETGLIGNRSNKIVKKSFYVLKNTNCPAFLVENGFMDSATDIPAILSENHAEKTAKGFLDFLIASFGLAKKHSTGNAGSAGTNEKKEVEEIPENKNKMPYTVKITASLLNVRAGAGTEHKINTCVKSGEVFTIVEESGGWGKLKSGAGWINLKYTAKC